MRYRIGDDVTAAPVTGTDDVLVATCVISVLIGVLLTWAGWRGRQWWLVFWCGGLVPVSLATLAWEVARRGN